MEIPYFPESAPFSPGQRAWLNGYLAGLFSGEGALRAAGPAVGSAPAAPAAAPQAGEKVTLLFGSQSGTAEKLSYRFAKILKQSGFDAAVMGMEKFSCAQLAQEGLLLILTSTYGEGAPPDNAQALHRELHAADLDLSGLRYSVLALGDSNYEKFCQCGMDFDLRLETLGARRLAPRVDADVEYEEAATRWQDEVLAALQSFRGGGGGLSPEAARSPEASASVSVPAPGPAGPTPQGGGAALLTAELVENLNLHPAQSSKDTRHLAFRFASAAPEYEPGDALEVTPENCPALVGQILAATGFSGHATVTGSTGSELTLREALARQYNIAKLSQATLKAFAEKGALESLFRLLDPSRRQELQGYLHGRDLVDLLTAHPGVLKNPQELVSMLPKLAPRLYSIASSRMAHPREIHLTVGVVRYRAHERDRKGVCSTFLAERVDPGAPVRVRLRRNDRFRLPADPDRPVIMVGPGTGIAPFRGFLQQRRAAGARGPNWLFFGNPHAGSDYLYRDELAEMRGSVLTRLDTAFSRDQERKVYVQHLMAEQGEALWRWLEEGAHLYVCGDAFKMAKDVDAALREIVRGHGGKSEDQALAYLESLKRENRYQRDVY